MRKLNQFIFKRRSAKHLQQCTRKRQWIDYEQAKTILLLFESDYIEKNRFIRQAIDSLAKDGKRVSAWGFLDKETTNTAILPSFKILDRSSVDWLERPKEPFLRELAEAEFDLLIDLTQHDIIPLQYVCLYADARLKMGMSHRTMNDLLDFCISMPSPETETRQAQITEDDNGNFNHLNETPFHSKQQFLYEQIIHYLKTIRSEAQ